MYSYKGYLKRSGLFSHWNDLFQKDVTKAFSSLLLKVSHVDLPYALSHQVQSFIVKSGFNDGGFVRTFAHCEATSNFIIKYARSSKCKSSCATEDSCFWRVRLYRETANSFELVSGKNGTKSCIWKAKVLMFSRLIFPTYQEKNKCDFCSTCYQTTVW